MESINAKEEIAKQRRYKVFKSNEIIKRAKQDFSLNELKVLSFALSMIRRGDSADKIYSFKIADYRKLLGLSKDAKVNRNIKASLKRLRDKSFWIKKDNGEETTASWFNKVWIDEKRGYAKVKFDEDIQGYIMGIYDDFSAWSLLYELPMASKYSIIMYELAQAYSFQGGHTFEIQDLKEKLGATNYTQYKDFRRRVLEVSEKEINAFTNIKISFKPIPKGNTFVKVRMIVEKRNEADIDISEYIADNILDGQITLEDGIKEREQVEKIRKAMAGK